MTQTSRLVLEVDSRSAEQRVNETRQALERLDAEGLQAPKAMKATGDSIAAVGGAAKATTPQLGIAERQFKSLASAAAGLAGPIAAAFSVAKIAAAAQQYTDLTNRLRLVTESSAQLARAQDDVFKVAQASRQSLETTASVYQRIAQNGKQLGLSFSEVASITETVSKSVALSGASAASADAALVQFGQALASGALRGDELNSILEQTPALAQTIARGLGVTIGQLRTMGAEGQLTSEKIIAAIASQKDAVDKLAATMQVTAGQAMTAFANSLTTTIGKLDQATGASNSFANSVLSVSRALDGFNSGEFLDFFRGDKQSIAGFNNDIGVTISKIRDLTAARGKLNPSDASDTVLFNFKFYNRSEIDSEISGLNKHITDTRKTITDIQKSNSDLGAELPKGDAIVGGLSATAKAYVDTQQKALAKLQDNNDAVKEANRYIAEHKELTDADKAAILSNAYATNAQTKANKDATAAIAASKKAYTEDAGTKMLDQARKQYAVLQQQGLLIDDQAAGTQKLGTEAKKLIELEQQIADIKTKQSLTADQKSILAMAEMNVAQQKRNADLEKEVELKKRSAEETKKLAAFQENLNSQLDLAKEGLSNQLAGLGMGDKARQRLQDDLKIQQSYQKQMNELTKSFNESDRGEFSQDRYDKETAMIQDALAERLGYQQGYYRDLDLAQSDWRLGASAAWQDYVDEASDIAGQTYDLFSNSLHGIEDAFVELATDGKLSFKDLADSIIADLARIAAKTLIVRPLISALFGSDAAGGGSTSVGGLVGSLFGGSGSGGGSSSSLGGLVSLGKNLYSAWNTVTGVGSSVASGYASGGVSGAFSGGAGYYSDMLASISDTMGSGFSSLASTFTGVTAAQTAATLAAQGVTSAVLSGAVTEGSAAIGAQFTTGVATTTAATYAAAEAGAAATAASLGGQISAAVSSAAAMWPLAVIMGMYQSGKLYDAGVRPDAGEVRDSAGSTTLGKVAMTPGVLQAGLLKGVDSALGKVVGGKWAAILSGSTFHQAVWTAVGGKLFGSGYETKDTGIELGVDGGVFDAQQYTKQKKKGGWLSGSSKTRYLYDDLPAESMDAFGGAFNDKIIGSLGMFSALGVQLSDSVLDGLNVAATKISTKGKTSEAIQVELDAWFTGLGDSAVAAINTATSSGLDGFTFEHLTTFVNNLYAVNKSFDLLGVKMVDFTVVGGRAVESLVTLAGGIEALNTHISAYYDNFTSDTQKAEDTLAAVNAQFAQLGMILPATRDGYREMLQALDLTSAYGQGMFNGMTAYAEQAAAAYSILEQRAAAATANFSTYYDAFFSETEKADDTLSNVSKQFSALNVALPESRDGFRALVEGLDRSASAGEAMYQSLMAVSGSAAAAFDIMETRAADAAKAIADALMGAVSGSYGAVQRAISAQQKATTEAYNKQTTALNTLLSTATENVSGLTSVGNDLSVALKALRGDSDDAVKMLRAQAQATLQSALATAKTGGSLSGFAGLSDALDTVSNNNTDLYGSMEDFARDQGRTANAVAELNAINGKQLSSAEQAAKTLKEQIDLAKAAYDAQMAQFDSQLAFAQAQMDALNGVDNSVMGVTAAINAMNLSVVAALAAISGKASAGTATNNGTLIDSVYKDLLGREADAAGKDYWQGQLANGAISYDQLAQAIANAAKENGQAVKAGYATGGFISGPGTGTSDSIIARLSNGEYVLTADAVRTYGTGLLDQMNAGQLPAFASGGGIRLVGNNESGDVAGPRYSGGAKSSVSASAPGSQQGVIDAITALQSYLYMITKYSEQTASGVRRQNEMQGAA